MANLQDLLMLAQGGRGGGQPPMPQQNAMPAPQGGGDPMQGIAQIAQSPIGQAIMQMMMNGGGGGGMPPGGGAPMPSPGQSLPPDAGPAVAAGEGEEGGSDAESGEEGGTDGEMKAVGEGIDSAQWSSGDTPDAEDIKRLRADPELMPSFIKTFGRDSLPADMFPEEMQGKQPIARPVKMPNSGRAVKMPAEAQGRRTPSQRGYIKE